MDKSRQRKPEIIKSNLNIYREIIVFTASAILWTYCLTVIIVIIGSILSYNNNFIQSVRIILNIEKRDIINILNLFLIESCIIFLYFFLAYIFNVKKNRNIT